MNAPREVSVAARPWLVQAAEDLATALIAHGIATRKIHDLVELQSSLISGDAVTVSSDDIDLPVPWNIAGRYRPTSAILVPKQQHRRWTPPGASWMP